MADVLIDSDQVIGEWDPDGRSWSARDWTPGPAGTAGLVLPGGVELDVDVASPATFVGLRVEWAQAGEIRRAGRRALRRLLGDDRAAELLGLGSGPGVAVRLGQHGPSAARTTAAPGTPRRQTRGVAPRLARVAMATAAAGPGAPAAAQALSWLDAAIAAASIGPGVGFGGRARRDGASAAALLLDVARRGELRGQPVDPAALGRALDELLPLLADELAAPIRALQADVASGRLRLRWSEPAAEKRAAGGRRAADRSTLGDVAQPAAAAAPMRLESVAPRRAVARLLDVDRRALPDAFAASAVAARATTPSEAELRIPGQADAAPGWWARAFGDDDVILAAAPLLADKNDAVARLLVPPGRLAGIEIDITDRPGEPREPRRARRIVEAVATGQAAARAERLGLSWHAGRRWSSCAATWEAAGAGEKAGLASELAQGRSDPGRIPPPLLADALVEELEG